MTLLLLCVLIVLTSRISLYSDNQRIVTHFALDEISEEPELGYNLAPSRMIASVVEDDGRRVLQSHSWGVHRHYEGRKPQDLINARADQLLEPPWRALFRSGRSIIPVDNFFLFADVDKVNTPFLFSRTDGEMMGLAAIWEAYRRDDASTGRRCVILTTKPNALIGKIHARSPAILQEKDYADWFDNDADEMTLMSLLKPYLGELDCYPVTRKMLNSRYEAPDVITPEWDFGKPPDADQPSLF
jgi:putative SOS response-associated peptidase YedK